MTLCTAHVRLRVPHRTASGVWTRSAQQHRAGDRRHRRPDGIDHLGVWIGAFLAVPKRQLVERRARDAVAARTSERRGVNFNGDVVAQVDALAGFTFDHLRQHRHRLQQAAAVTHDHAGLPSVGGHDHNSGAFAWAEMGPPVAEARAPLQSPWREKNNAAPNYSLIGSKREVTRPMMSALGQKQT